MQITKIIRNDQLNKKGEAKVYIRVNDGAIRKFITTKISIVPKFWDSTKEIIKSSHPLANTLNRQLNSKFLEIQKSLLKDEKLSMTTIDFNNVLYGNKVNYDCFIKFAEEHNKTYLVKQKKSAFDKSKSTLEKIKRFQKGKILPFLNLTYSWCQSFEKFLREDCSNKTNTVYSNFRYIKTICNYALKSDVISAPPKGITIYKVKEEQVKRDFLTEREVKLITDTDFKNNLILSQTKDLFTFGLFTGLRISDILTLTNRNYNDKENRIHVLIRKTNTEHSLFLPNIAKDIVFKYYNPIYADATIFPHLKIDLSNSDFIQIDNAISRATALFNKHLKTLAIKVGFNKNISSHIMRHSFATNLLSKGIDIYTVSKLLNHSKVSQTQTYAKLVQSQLDNAMQVFN